MTGKLDSISCFHSVPLSTIIYPSDTGQRQRVMAITGYSSMWGGSLRRERHREDRLSTHSYDKKKFQTSGRGQEQTKDDLSTSRQKRFGCPVLDICYYIAGAGAGRSWVFWLEPEPKFSPGSGSYSYSKVL